MIEPIEFEVLGNPAPQGSKRHVGRGIMVESSKALKPWRDSVAQAAQDVARELDLAAPLDLPLKMGVVFRFHMPTSRRKAVREAGVAPKTSAPDLDKLVRAVGDALKIGGLIRDDALIWGLEATKVEVMGWTGAIIRLEGLR